MRLLAVDGILRIAIWRVHAESVPTFVFFLQNGFLKSAKDEQQIQSGCVVASGAEKTGCLKKFDIRKVGGVRSAREIARCYRLLRSL